MTSKKRYNLVLTDSVEIQQRLQAVADYTKDCQTKLHWTPFEKEATIALNRRYIDCIYNRAAYVAIHIFTAILDTKLNAEITAVSRTTLNQLAELEDLINNFPEFHKQYVRIWMELAPMYDCLNAHQPLYKIQHLKAD